MAMLECREEQQLLVSRDRIPLFITPSTTLPANSSRIICRRRKMDDVARSWPVAPSCEKEEHACGTSSSFHTPPNRKESATAAAQRRRQLRMRMSASSSTSSSTTTSLARQLMGRVEDLDEEEEERRRKCRHLTLAEAHGSIRSPAIQDASSAVCRYMCRDALHGESLAAASLWTLAAAEEQLHNGPLLQACKDHIHSAAFYMAGHNFPIDAHTVEVALSICTCAVLQNRKGERWFVDDACKLLFSAACFTIACKFCQSVEGRQMRLLRDWMKVNVAGSCAGMQQISMAGLFDMEVRKMHGASCLSNNVKPAPCRR